MNTKTTKLFWLSGLAMAITAVSGIAALSSGYVMSLDQARWIQSQCADSNMPDFCAADLRADFATSVADTPPADVTEDAAPVAEIWDRLRSGFVLPSNDDPEVRRLVPGLRHMLEDSGIYQGLLRPVHDFKNILGRLCFKVLFKFRHFFR